MSEKAAGKRRARQEVPDEDAPQQPEEPAVYLADHAPPAGFPATDAQYPGSTPAPLPQGSGPMPSYYPSHPHSLHHFHPSAYTHPAPYPSPYPSHPLPGPPRHYPVAPTAPHSEHRSDGRQDSPDIVIKEEPSDDDTVFPEIRTILAEPVAGKKRQRKSAAGAKGKGVAANSPALPQPSPAAAAGGRRQPAASNPGPARRGGRQPGATGYTDADLTEMLRLVRMFLPIGPDEWATVVAHFNKWARANGRGERQVKAFRSKWDAIVRTPKPTGKAEVPWFVEESWDINDLIEQRAHVRPLNDARIDSVEQPRGAGGQEVIEIMDTDEEEESKRYVVRKKARTANASAGASPSVAAGTAPRGQTRTGMSNNLISSIASAFDPAVQTARDEARAARHVDNFHLQSLISDLHHYRLRNETLQERYLEEKRRGDRLEDELRRRDEHQAFLEQIAKTTGEPYYSVHARLFGTPASRRIPEPGPAPPRAIEPAPTPGPSNQSSRPPRHGSPILDRASIAAMAALAREEAGEAHVPLRSRERLQGMPITPHSPRHDACPSDTGASTQVDRGNVTAPEPPAPSHELDEETSYEVTVTPRKRRTEHEGSD
ncbi:uncharacterized protein C8Q71DRAFT_897019 [Rhodofomes roseus]|uniref:DUF6818 domain-containing protein n=1 Tax=Rhodofomes roseus TaxID=34475 RepID=A0ABQ8KL49_9APHY|nr:uncharacterized protein C8Q71DRAFT_897019 [Rhodofomes roseus]KAH9838635.1 hypothetical protein C8Q71DRAFT_897019 [Rhodofomes roseus]